MEEMAIFNPDWTFPNPPRFRLIECYNQVFAA